MLHYNYYETVAIETECNTVLPTVEMTIVQRSPIDLALCKCASLLSLSACKQTTIHKSCCVVGCILTVYKTQN